jgi:hypothetical protein
MAWCVMERVEGPCRPDNSLYRFEESLKKYYLEEIPEAERKRRRLSHAGMYVSSVSLKYYSEVGSIVDHKVIEPLAPHEFPTEVLLRKNYSTLGAWLELQLGVIAVEERLKALIEGLEPGVHRFWPLRLVKPNGQDFPTRYYGIVIDRFLHSFLPEATKPEVFETISEGYYDVRGIGTRAKYNAMTFSAATINGAHLWRESRLSNPKIFISDELKAAIDAAGLKIPTHYAVKTV